MKKRVKISCLALITLHTELTVSVNNYFTPPGFHTAKNDITANTEVIKSGELNSTDIMSEF